MSFAPPGSFNQKAYQNSLDDQTHRRSAPNPLKPLSFDTSDATDAHKRSRRADHATIGKQTRTTNTLSVLEKPGSTQYSYARTEQKRFCFHNISITCANSHLPNRNPAPTRALRDKAHIEPAKIAAPTNILRKQYKRESDEV